MNAVRTAWTSRSARERTVLGFGAAILSVLLVYSFVWEPTRAAQKRLREYLPRLRVQAAQFAVDAAEAQGLRAGQPASGAAGSRASVEAVAEQLGMRGSITAVTELPEGRLQVALEAVPFDTLVRWTGALPGSAGYSVESARLHSGSAPGIVRAESIVLKRVGAI